MRLGGVIATFTGSPNHGFLLRDALEAAKLPPLLGTLRRNGKWTLPERHLGLATDRVGDVWLDSLAEAAEDEIDLDALLALASAERPEEAEDEVRGDTAARLAVARDEAFHFYYEDNFRILRSAGVELVDFLRFMTISCRKMFTASTSAAVFLNSMPRSSPQTVRCWIRSGILPRTENGFTANAAGFSIFWMP